MLEAGSVLLRAKVHTALRDLLRGAGSFPSTVTIPVAPHCKLHGVKASLAAGGYESLGLAPSAPG